MPKHSKYNTHIEPRLDEIKAWRSQRLSIPEIAKRLSVGLSTLNNERYRPELEEALKLPELSSEEKRKQIKNAARNRDKSFNSFLSFLRLHANELERFRIFETGISRIENLKEIEELQDLIDNQKEKINKK